VEIIKSFHGLNPTFIFELFIPKSSPYSLRSSQQLIRLSTINMTSIYLRILADASIIITESSEFAIVSQSDQFTLTLARYCNWTMFPRPGKLIYQGDLIRSIA